MVVILPKQDFEFVFALVTSITFGRFIFQRLVELFLGLGWVNCEKSKHGKFAESAFKSVYYSMIWPFGVYIACFQEGFFWSQDEAWGSWPNNWTFGPLPRTYYLIQLSFYVHSTLVHFHYETKRSDFWPMFAHHVITSILVWGSYQMEMYRVGMMVLILCDLSDILFENGKMMLYCGYQKVANIMFIGLMVIWFVTRIILFSYKCLWTCLAYGPQMRVPWGEVKLYLFCVVLLHLIGVLNVFWFTQMIAASKRFLKGEKVRDTREE